MITHKNKGREKAEAAAQKYGGKAVFPAFQDTGKKPTDFNDLHCQEGPEAVCLQIEAALRHTTLRALNISQLLNIVLPPRKWLMHPIITASRYWYDVGMNQETRVLD